jgi:hypothetical protein
MSKNLLLLLTCILCYGCSTSKPELLTANTSAPASNQPVYKPGPQPTDAELRGALDRNYEGAVTIDHTRPVSFLTGDFNGDDSEDVAIVVKPEKGKLPDLNSEYVNWILEDPHQILTKEQKKPPSRPAINGTDTLLAVIHGYGRDGWRNSLARQTYLLKNAVGDQFEKQSGEQLGSADRSVSTRRGDVIREKLNGTTGLIFWTGARYTWRPAG